jgi:hypothetical protein
MFFSKTTLRMQNEISLGISFWGRETAMKRDYIDLKEELRNIRIDAGSFANDNGGSLETEPIKKLYDDIEKMEEFQQILLVGIQDRLRM